VTGNIISSPHEPLFLLDESLTPAVADALNLVGYNFATVYDTFTDRGALDPEIIAWCRNNGAAWVHADDRARRAHQALLQTSGIRTLLVSRERGRMSAKEQLRILSVVLPKLLENWQRRPATRHYRATAVSPVSTPSLRPVTI
jgi:predicted nuclease of predicted toxin-antitoxin system